AAIQSCAARASEHRRVVVRRLLEAIDVTISAISAAAPQTINEPVEAEEEVDNAESPQAPEEKPPQPGFSDESTFTRGPDQQQPQQPQQQQRTDEGSITGFLRNVGRGLDALRPQPLTDAQRRSLEYVHAMLEPDKLGGADRTFNFADTNAVVGGLMRD